MLWVITVVIGLLVAWGVRSRLDCLTAREALRDAELRMDCMRRSLARAYAAGRMDDETPPETFTADLEAVMQDIARRQRKEYAA